MNIDISDVQLKTLANIPYDYSGIPIRPKTISEIVASYKDYNESLSLIGLTTKDVFPNIAEADPNAYLLEKSLVEVLLITRNFDFLLSYLSAFEYFIGTSIELLTDGNALKINGALFEYEELNHIATILKIQNCVISKDDDDFNPLNDRARKLREKILQRQKKLKEIKGSDAENQLTFQDLISILASNGNGISIINIFSLNYYQFNDQFNRMKMIDEYNVSIQALIHGADSKDVQLKHWISKMSY